MARKKVDVVYAFGSACVRVNFTTKPKFALAEGRNGYYKQKGLEVEYAGYRDPPIVRLLGTTSRDAIARGHLVIPPENMPSFIEALQEVQALHKKQKEQRNATR